MVNAVSVGRLPFQPLHHSEPLRTADWLALYKLQDYVPLFEANGYDNTDFLVGISQEVSLAQTTSGVGGGEVAGDEHLFCVQELVELGVQKVGHRKKILAALSNITTRDHLFTTKPVRDLLTDPNHPSPHFTPLFSTDKYL